MIVAVLGANGQLGSDILRAAAAAEHGVETRALCRNDLDVCDLGAIPRALAKEKFDVLINCTGYHKTDEVEAHATEAFRINTHAVGALARACKARRAWFVQISTDYVFDGEGQRSYVEEDDARPLNVYGASKLLGEKLAQREHEDGTIIVRVASLFGVAGSSGKGGNFVETMLKKGKESGEVRVVNDIAMSPTSTADAARVILDLLRKNAASGVYHVVNSGAATWFEFARQIIEEAGVEARVTPVTSGEYPTAAVRPAYTVLDNAKASRIAGEIRDWKHALREYLIEKGHMQFSQARSQGAGFSSI
jgi:dTDP-4-dehydrorhamnose reductase